MKPAARDFSTASFALDSGRSDGVKRAVKKATVRVTSAGVHTATLTIGGIGDIAYWSPENPILYVERSAVGIDVPGPADHEVGRQLCPIGLELSDG